MNLSRLKFLYADFAKGRELSEDDFSFTGIRAEVFSRFHFRVLLCRFAVI